MTEGRGEAGSGHHPRCVGNRLADSQLIHFPDPPQACRADAHP